MISMIIFKILSFHITIVDLQIIKTHVDYMHSFVYQDCKRINYFIDISLIF